MYFLLLIALILPVYVQGNQIDVLKISDVPFPTTYSSNSTKYHAAEASSTMDTDIPEFTVCYRMLIDSYNERDFSAFGAAKMAMNIILIFWIECVGNVEEVLKVTKVLTLLLREIFSVVDLQIRTYQSTMGTIWQEILPFQSGLTSVILTAL